MYQFFLSWGGKIYGDEYTVNWSTYCNKVNKRTNPLIIKYRINK